MADLDVMKQGILGKQEYAESVFPGITTLQDENKKSSTLSEIRYQIRVCEELGMPLDKVDIKELCTCTSAMGVSNRAYRMKKRYV
mgnify:CR=1 FL=1